MKSFVIGLFVGLALGGSFYFYQMHRYPLGDLNHDGKVNYLDVSILSHHLTAQGK